MNIRRKRPHDSLYMLLDTMCNAFGGIILLAVLVTLLTNRERLNRAGATSDNDEMLQRRLALAETNLQQALALGASLQARADDPKQHQQVALLGEREDVQASLRQIREAESKASRELDAAAGLDPAERAKDLQGQLASAEVRKAEAQNKLKATEEEKKRLKQRLDDLEKQVKSKSGELVQTLRLPREYATGKQVIYVIIEYGQIYPCRNADLSRNEVTITWKTQGEHEDAYPIKGRGLDTGRPAALQGFLASLPKETVYLAFLVFEDSFGEFNVAKKMATAQGLAYGWEPYRNAEAPVGFGPNGHTPKPQ